MLDSKNLSFFRKVGVPVAVHTGQGDHCLEAASRLLEPSGEAAFFRWLAD